MESLERRRHIRLQRDEKLFVQVVSASESPELVGKTYFCKTLDVSESGLKIIVQNCVPNGSELELWVQIQSLSTKYFLHGFSQWCDDVRRVEGSYELGIRLSPRSDTDFGKWQYLFDGHINKLLTQ